MGCMVLLSQVVCLGAPTLPAIYSYLPQTGNELRQGFANPPREAAPWVYWFWWDGVLSEDEIERELNEIANAGFGGAEIRCVTFHGWGGDPLLHMDRESLDRIGQRRVEYLSDDFVEILKFTCTTAHKLGLRLGIGVGQGWPPGGPWIPDQYRTKLLHATSNIIEGPTEFSVPSTFENRNLLAWKLDASAEKRVLPNSFIDLASQATFRRDADGTDSWKVPPGKWLIGDFRILPGGICDKGEGPEVDPASREAVLFHLQHLFGRLDPHLKSFYGTTIVDVASDSWEYYRGDNRFWSLEVLAEFPRIAGYDLTKKFYTLLDFGPDLDSTIQDLEKVERKLVHENFFATAASFLHDRGLRHRAQVYGRGLARDFLEAYARADIPEIEQGINLPEAVWASHTMGHTLTSAEAFTFLDRRHDPVRWHNGPGEATPALLRFNSNYHFSEGINRLYAHSFSYSPPQLPLPGWKMYADIHLNRNVPWWPQINHLTKWIGRNQWVLQSGSPVAEVLVYPLKSESLEEPYRQQGNSQPTSASNGIDGANRYTLPIIRTRIESGEYQFSNLCLLNDVTDRQEALDLLTIADHAQHLICCNKLPQDWSVLQSEGAEELRKQVAALESRGLVVDVSHKNWFDSLTRQQSVRWKPEQHELTYQHRRLHDLDLFFVANFGQTFSGLVSFPFTSKSVEIWDADTGEIRQAAVGYEQDGRSYVKLTLNHAESTIISFSPGIWPTHVARASLGQFRFEEDKTLVGRFFEKGPCEVTLNNGSKQNFLVAIPAAVEFEKAWTLRAPEQLAISNSVAGEISLPRLVSWRQIPELHDFAGAVSYETEFELTPDQIKPNLLWELCLGDVFEVAELTINSQKVGVSWSPPFRLDVTQFLKTGTNILQVKVANLLKNHTTKDLSYQRPSGLLGPVLLRPSRRVVLHLPTKEACTK